MSNDQENLNQTKSGGSTVLKIGVLLLVVVGIYVYIQQNNIGGQSANITSSQISSEPQKTQEPINQEVQANATEPINQTETNTQPEEITNPETQNNSISQNQEVNTNNKEEPINTPSNSETNNKPQVNAETQKEPTKQEEINKPKTGDPETGELKKNDNIKGSDTGEIIIVEYSNFLCENCFTMFKMIEESWFMIGSKVRFSFRYAPMDKYPNAKIAAQYAEAAGKQGKYWEMYDELFMKLADWKDAKTPGTVIEGLGKGIGLDVKKLKKDANSKDIIAKVEENIESAKKLKIDGNSPVVFVNGNMIENPPHKYGFMNMVTFKEREMKGLGPDGEPLNKTGTGK